MSSTGSSHCAIASGGGGAAQASGASATSGTSTTAAALHPERRELGGYLSKIAAKHL